MLLLVQGSTGDLIAIGVGHSCHESGSTVEGQAGAFTIHQNREFLSHISDRRGVQADVVEIVELNIDISGRKQIRSHDQSTSHWSGEISSWKEVGSGKAVVVVGRVIDVGRIHSQLIANVESIDPERSQLKATRFRDAEGGGTSDPEERVPIGIVDGNKATTD